MTEGVDEPVDKVPVGFIMKVYETRELAEEGADNNALLIFNNGIDDDTGANPLVANGGQYIDGTTDDPHGGGAKLYDEDAQFGSRLLGRTVKNTTDSTEAVIADVVSSVELTLDADIMDAAEKYYIENPGSFFIFKKYYYRIESTDPVSGFVIDWDDGEDNSPEKANREIIKLETARYYAITSHIYTTHGIHYPMIRTISPEGFYSKWYVSYDAVIADDLKSIETQSLVTTAALQNDFSIVSADNPQANPKATIRLSEFAPANMPPVGVLKVDRTSVYSGIDNSFITGLWFSSTAGATTGGAHTYALANPKAYATVLRDGVTVANAIDVIYKTTKNKIHKETISAISNDVGGGPGASLFPDNSSGEVAESGEYLKEILSVKLVQMTEGTATGTTYLAADDRVFIQVYASGASANAETDRVVAAVSLGNPIVTLDRPGFYVDVDGSQSQTRASNVSLQKYWFEEGKLEGNIRSHPFPPEVSDGFGESTDTVFRSGQTQPGTRIQYCFDYNRGNIIETGVNRFFDDEKLIRLQVEDTSATSRNDDTTYYSKGVAIDTGTNSNETVDASEVEITVVASSYLNIGDIIKIGGDTPGSSGSPRAELMKITDIPSSTTITVERNFEGTTDDTYVISSGQDIYRMTDDGRQGDTITRSFIEHWDRSGYSDNLNRPDSIKTRALLLYGNPTGGDATGAISWSDRAGANAYNVSDGTADVGANGADLGLVFGGIRDTSGTNSDNELMGGDATGHTETPLNWLLCCKSDKFNKLHFRMENTWRQGHPAVDSDGVYGDGSGGGGTANVSLMAWYTAQTSPSASTYEWKPLPIIDGTSTPDEIEDDYVSLRTSGTVSFDMPTDWVSIQASDLTSDAAPPAGSGPVALQSGSDTDDPETLWSENMYGLLIGIAVNGTGTMDNYKCFSVIPYNNSHSQVIRLIDPHHKSLNTVAIAQSISWKKQGKFIEITDRLGRSDLRRIGAAGGAITFGGVELSGDYTTTKEALARYQREAIPVYLDIQRANGDYIRVYGVITSMSEDYPTGNQTPKFGITMQTEYIAEYDSSGLWITDGLVPLGGEIIDEPKYLL